MELKTQTLPSAVRLHDFKDGILLVNFVYPILDKRGLMPHILAKYLSPFTAIRV
jgi:hypothetical protein